MNDFETRARLEQLGARVKHLETYVESRLLPAILLFVSMAILTALVLYLVVTR